MARDLFAKVQEAIDPEWMFRVLREMILIRSENPFDEPAREGFREKEMADYLAGHLAGLGLKVETREVRPGRPNVFGTFGGKRGHSTLMLAGHMDTARTTGYPEAYDVQLEGDKLHGRGACDMKAALAAYLGVVKALRETGTRAIGACRMSTRPFSASLSRYACTLSKGKSCFSAMSRTVVDPSKYRKRQSSRWPHFSESAGSSFSTAGS